MPLLDLVNNITFPELIGSCCDDRVKWKDVKRQNLIGYGWLDFSYQCQKISRPWKTILCGCAGGLSFFVAFPSCALSHTRVHSPILAHFVRQTKKKERLLAVYSIKASTDILINNPWSTLSRLTFDRHFDGHLIDSWLIVSRVFTNSYILINTWWRICKTYWSRCQSNVEWVLMEYRLRGSINIRPWIPLVYMIVLVKKCFQLTEIVLPLVTD